MKHPLVLATVLLSLSSAIATDSDLVLPGEKWLSRFDKFVCAAFGPAVIAPASLGSMNIAFETMTTDSTLDNGLLKATFTQDGAQCRYSAIVFADNAAATLRLVQSKAFAPLGGSDCALGKDVLDRAFAPTDYLYYGHPHNLAILMHLDDAETICGPGATRVGVNFVVTGRIAPPAPAPVPAANHE